MGSRQLFFSNTHKQVCNAMHIHVFRSGPELREQVSQLMKEEEQISEGWATMYKWIIKNCVWPVGWDKTVHDHLKALASNPVETLWPRDTLFKYVQHRHSYEMAWLLTFFYIVGSQILITNVWQYRYYQLMEQLQENLEEYDKLQQLASEWHSIKCQSSPNGYWFIVTFKALSNILLFFWWFLINIVLNSINW